jgi:hypothetical protein
MYALEIITTIKEIGSIYLLVDDMDDPSVAEILLQPWVDVWKCVPYDPNDSKFRGYKRLKRVNEE